MKVFIFRETSAVIAEPKGAQRKKQFFKSWGQQYYTPPVGFVRMNRVHFGKELPPEEVIAFSEGEIIPYHPKDLPWDMDWILENIDMEKDMPPTSFIPSSQWWESGGKGLGTFLSRYGGYVLVGLVLVYAVLKGTVFA